MADNEVRIVLSAIDRASGVLQSAQQGARGLFGSFTELSSALGLATQAFGVVKSVMDQVVGATMEYGLQVRDTARMMGTSTEEASKLIQVADDLRVDMGTLKFAFRTALREGISPNIEGLKQLSAEYQALPDPTQRAQYAMEKFGRAGLEMAKILEQTPEAIDAMAQSAHEAGLVMSEEAVRAAEEYYKALDDLQDAQQGLKITIGNETIPVLTREISILSDLTEAIRDEIEESGILASNYDILIGLATRRIKLHQDEAYATRVATSERRNENVAITATARAVDYMSAEFAEADRYARMMEVEMRNLERAQTAVSLSAEELQQRYSDLQLLMAGPLGQEAERFAEQQGDIEEQMRGITAEIAELEGRSYLTADQREELEGLKTELGNLSTAYADNAAAHEEATRRILLDLAAQALAQNSLKTDTSVYTEGEIKLLENLATQWGLVDDTTAGFWLMLQTEGDRLAQAGFWGELEDKIDNYGDKILGAGATTTTETGLMQTNWRALLQSGVFEDAVESIDDIRTALLNLPEQVTVKITTSVGSGTTTPQPTTPTPPGGGRNGGEDEWVPPGGNSIRIPGSRSAVPAGWGNTYVEINVYPDPGMDELALAEAVAAKVASGRRAAVAGAYYTGV